MNPATMKERAHTEYSAPGNDSDLQGMIRENLIAERIAIDHYRELARYFGDNDPATRVMIEHILAQEEEHANDMHDLLVAHEGRPDLQH